MSANLLNSGINVIRKWSDRWSLVKLTNEKSLVVAIIIIPMCIKQMDTVMYVIFWLTWVPIFIFQYTSAACVLWTPRLAFDTNPNVFKATKLPNGFRINLVILWFSHGFEKTSRWKSIQCFRFTEFLGISICFKVRMEAVDNKYFKPSLSAH